ncbi:MAG: InlB B-repeat-containing protein [Oscillospiraceae bacterium]|nr:InlB B-repeat-containing protein [Oscillospiraceae bacterium]
MMKKLFAILLTAMLMIGVLSVAAGAAMVIRLDKQGGTGGPDSITPVYQQWLPEIDMPARKGYVFHGYYDTKEVFNYSTCYYTQTGAPALQWPYNLSSYNSIIYAAWSSKSYTVTLDKQNGTGGSNTVMAVYDSDNHTVIPPTRDGHDFAGYYDAVDGGTMYIKANGDVARIWDIDDESCVLYARWKQVVFSVTFDKQDGTGGSDGVVAALDADMPAIALPMRSGYVFAGYFDAVSGGTEYYTVTGQSARTWNKEYDAVLYARWTARTYSVTFDKQNGSDGSDGVTAQFDKAMPAITLPLRGGYTFDGYVDNKGVVYYTAAGAAAKAWDKTEAAVLYACWVANTYLITFDQQSGTGGSDSVTVTFDAAMPSVTVPVRTNYQFTGYYDAVDGGSQYYDANGTSLRNWDKPNAMTLYARWQGNAFTVTLDKQGGSGGPDSVTALYTGSLPAVTIPVRTGYSFTGYFDEVSGGVQYYAASGVSLRTWDKTDAATLYARWTANTYTVRYNANGGSGTMANSSHSYDAAKALTANAFTVAEGYFTGWAASAGGAAVYTNGQSVSNLSAVNGAVVDLYAVWMVADKAQLNARVAALAGTQKGNYTDATWSTFQIALTSARSAANNPNATQEQVNNALSSLNTAFSGLRENPPQQGVFGTKPQYNKWYHYILFFLAFGFIWMWF